MNADFDAVSRLVSRYAVAFHTGDSDGLARMFHESCVLRTSQEGKITDFTLVNWLDHVASRASPASQGHTLDVRLRGIDFAGPDCAYAIVEMTVPGTHFVDCLHILRTQAGWQIAGKIFQATQR